MHAEHAQSTAHSKTKILLTKEKGKRATASKPSTENEIKYHQPVLLFFC